MKHRLSPYWQQSSQSIRYQCHLTKSTQLIHHTEDVTLRSAIKTPPFIVICLIQTITPELGHGCKYKYGNVCVPARSWLQSCDQWTANGEKESLQHTAKTSSDLDCRIQQTDQHTEKRRRVQQAPVWSRQHLIIVSSTVFRSYKWTVFGLFVSNLVLNSQIIWGYLLDFLSFKPALTVTNRGWNVSDANVSWKKHTVTKSTILFVSWIKCLLCMVHLLHNTHFLLTDFSCKETLAISWKLLL